MEQRDVYKRQLVTGIYSAQSASGDAANLLI